ALSVYDHRGRCALHYAAQVKSTLREELVHLLLESLSQPAFEPDYFDLEDPSTKPPLSPLTQSVLIQSPAKTEELEDRNSQGVSLPSLWDRGRRGDRLCSLDTGQGQVKMTGRSCQPMTPRTAGRGDSLNPNLTAPHPPQLSQSAPLLGEPLLDSGSMLRVRAHIQTRLGGSELDTEINGRRRSLPILCPRPVRTPRHLAPLDRGQREGTLLLGPRHPLPLKPITLLPLASMSKVKRERLSRRGSRGSRRAKGGSEESSSSSVSSQGSLDLEEEQQEEEDAEEEEEEEEDRESTGATANQPQGNEKSNPNKIHKNKEKGSGTFYHTNQSFNVLAHNRITRRSKLNQRSTSRSSHLKANITNPPDLIVSGEASVKPCAPKTSSSKTGQKTTAPHLPRNRSSEQLRPVLKRSGGDKGSSNKLEALARKQSLQRDLKCTRQPKKVGVLGTPRAKSAVDFVTYSDMFREINQGHEGPAIYEMFATPVYENIRKSTLSVRVSPRQIQSAPPRKTQGRRNYRCPKPSENNQQKKTQREKSNPTSGKHQKRSDVLPRGKPHRPLVSEEEEKDTVFISGLNWNIKTTRSELNFEEEKESYALVDQEGEQTLSVIEEVLSNYLSETCVNLVLTEDENPHTQSQPQEITQQIPNDHLSSYMQDANEGPMASGFKNDHGCVKAEATSSKSFPCHPMINTWTSGSSDRTMSPMFRKYLDVAGEGPLTDDLLQNLAKELISLEEREVTLQPERRDSGPGGEREASQTDTRHPLPQVYCGLTSQGQLIAVKQVALDDSDPESGAREYQRLQDEVDLLKTLHHTNIVGFLGTTLQDNVVSIFMEYVPGGSIASIIHRFGPLPEKVLVLYTRQILEGVAYLHENRVIHRDLKGNNVMLMPTGIVKLIDFGCARRLSCLTHTNSNSELLRSVHGTPYWMAPEVINETGHGRKSDIWSIGCTVFEMATGRPPLAHMDKMAALFYIGARRGLMPTLPDEFSEDAKNFVQACLTRSPSFAFC
ncbi:hypothetical protein JZ751_029437, partial [Albula glossodonta]